MPKSSDERPRRTVEGLKKEAKNWLAQIRLGNAEARKRFDRIYPNARHNPLLRDVQHAVALEHGCSGWTELKEQLQASVDPDFNRANWFLEHACIDPILTNGPAMQEGHFNAARRILKHHPEVARANIHTATVCGELASVQRILSTYPDTADTPGGPVRFRYNPARESLWTPLLHLCYGRVPTNAMHSVAIARALLDHGANPNAFFEVGSHPSRYTCLTGLVGGGEEGTPPHPEADMLIALLLDRGADPIDAQLLYNAVLGNTVFRWLDLLYERSVTLGRGHEWNEPRWNPKRGMSAFDWLMNFASSHGDRNNVEWLLARGARSDAPVPQLVSTNTGDDPFIEACFSRDAQRARELLRDHPEFLHSHRALFAAAQENRADIVAFILDLGVPIDVEDTSKQRALHVAASSNAFEVAELLISRGANLEAQETGWNNTPLDHAIYGNQKRMIEILSNHSTDVFRLVSTGNLTRLRELLRTQPELARARTPCRTPLMCLPNDEDQATEVSSILLALGADPRVLDEKGRTASQLAARRGLDDVAEQLRQAESK